jgi:hypothetical protein
VNDGRRSQKAAIRPGVTGSAACRDNEVAGEPGSEVLSEGVEKRVA